MTNSLLYRGAVYQLISGSSPGHTSFDADTIWYHVSDTELVGTIRPLYLSDFVMDHFGNHVYAFTIDSAAIWGDIERPNEYQNGRWMPVVYGGMDSIGYDIHAIDKLVKAGFDVVWDRIDYARNYKQIFVVNPRVLTLVNHENQRNRFATCNSTVFFNKQSSHLMGTQ